MAEQGGPSLLIVLRLQDLLTGPLSKVSAQVDKFAADIQAKLTPPLKGAVAAQKEFAASSAQATTATSAQGRAAADLGEVAGSVLEPALTRSAVAEQSVAASAIGASSAIGAASANFAAGATAADAYSLNVLRATGVVDRFRTSLERLNSEAAVARALPARGPQALIGQGQAVVPFENRGALVAAQGQTVFARATRDATDALDIQDRQLATLGSSFNSFGKNILSIGANYARMAGTIAAATLTVQSFRREFQFEEEFARVPTLLSLTAEQTRRLRNEIVALSNSTGVEKGVLARGFYKALEEGARDAEEAQKLLLVGAQIQAAGLGTVEQGIEAVANSLDAYGKGIDSASRFGDIFVTTAQQSATALDVLGTKFDDLLPLAARSNISLERVSSLFIALRNSGTDAAKSTRLIREALESGFDAKSLEAISARGVDARKALDEIPDSFNKVGAAAEAAAIRLDSATGRMETSWNRLKNSFDERLGAPTLGIIDKLLRGLDGIEEKLKNIVPGPQGAKDVLFSGGIAQLDFILESLDSIIGKQKEIARGSTLTALPVQAQIGPNPASLDPTSALVARHLANLTTERLRAQQAAERLAAANLREAESEERIKTALPGVISFVGNLTTKWIEFRSSVIESKVGEQASAIVRDLTSALGDSRPVLEARIENSLRELDVTERLAKRAYPELRAALEEYRATVRSLGSDSSSARAELQAKVDDSLKEIRAIEVLSGSSYPDLRRAVEQYAIARTAQIRVDEQAAIVEEQEIDRLRRLEEQREKNAQQGRRLADVANVFDARQRDAEKNTFGGGFAAEIERITELMDQAGEVGQFAARGIFTAFTSGIDAMLKSIGTGENFLKAGATAFLGIIRDGLSQLISQQLGAAIFGNIIESSGLAAGATSAALIISAGGATAGAEMAAGAAAAGAALVASATTAASILASVNLVTGGLVGFAMGGKVAKGKPIIVGEMGREIFVPEESGRILSHSESMAAVARAFDDGEAAEAIDEPQTIRQIDQAPARESSTATSRKPKPEIVRVAVPGPQKIVRVEQKPGEQQLVRVDQAAPAKRERKPGFTAQARIAERDVARAPSLAAVLGEDEPIQARTQSPARVGSTSVPPRIRGVEAAGAPRAPVVDRRATEELSDQPAQQIATRSPLRRLLAPAASIASVGQDRPSLASALEDRSSPSVPASVARDEAVRESGRSVVPDRREEASPPRSISAFRAGSALSRVAATIGLVSAIAAQGAQASPLSAGAPRAGTSPNSSAFVPPVEQPEQAADRALREPRRNNSIGDGLSVAARALPASVFARASAAVLEQPDRAVAPAAPGADAEPRREGRPVVPERAAPPEFGALARVARAIQPPVQPEAASSESIQRGPLASPDRPRVSAEPTSPRPTRTSSIVSRIETVLRRRDEVSGQRAAAPRGELAAPTVPGSRLAQVAGGAPTAPARGTLHVERFGIPKSETTERDAAQVAAPRLAAAALGASSLTSASGESRVDPGASQAVERRGALPLRSELAELSIGLPSRQPSAAAPEAAEVGASPLTQITQQFLAGPGPVRPGDERGARDADQPERATGDRPDQAPTGVSVFSRVVDRILGIARPQVAAARSVPGAEAAEPAAQAPAAFGQPILQVLTGQSGSRGAPGDDGRILPGQAEPLSTVAKPDGRSAPDAGPVEQGVPDEARPARRELLSTRFLEVLTRITGGASPIGRSGEAGKDGTDAQPGSLESLIANVPVTGFARGGIASGPELAFIEPGRHDAFVPLPGANRGIPVEFPNGAPGSQSVTVHLTVNSLDPRTAADVVLAQMPKIQRALAHAIHEGTDRRLNTSIRGIGQ